MREITDEDGNRWEAVAVEKVVAHLKKGAQLAFRAADDPAAEPVRTPVEFNSPQAAELAIRTMSEKELRRRLEWAKAEAGVA